MKKKITLLFAFCAISIWSFGQIFITEIADPNDDASARYVELYNAGDTEVDLNTGYRIQRYTNANAAVTGDEALTGIIPAKGFYIVAADASGFEAAFGFAPDQDIGGGGPADSNGDDQIQLVDPSAAVLDIYGVPGEDGTGTCHEFEDGRAERKASVTTGNAGTWFDSNWNIWGDSDISGCTSHVTQPINTYDEIFDPREWIGQATPVINFVISSSEVAEDGVSIDVCATIRNPSASEATTVDINVSGVNTAVNGTDYSSITFPSTLTFPAGSSDNQCLTFTITDDTDEEKTDTISLKLENITGTNAAIGSKFRHTLLITDNDTPTCDLVLDPADAVCDAIALGTDTYTINIPYTGGGSSTYVITSKSGVITGDDPTSVASGSIVITGNNEGINDTISIYNTAAGGSCEYEIVVEAPVCYPDSYGNIFITEIADPKDNTSARYVELFNAGDEDVDLSAGFALQRYTNGNVDPQTIKLLTGIIPAKGFYIVVRNASIFESTYGFDPDQEIGDAGPADSNGDDQIQLVDPNSVVRDIFGVPGEDGTGTCHGFEDGRAERAITVTAENGGTWNEANWNVWGVTESLSCTNHITLAVNTTDNMFDPGVWIGYVPVYTIVNFEYLSSEIAENGATIDVCVTILNPDATNATTVDINVLDESTATNGSDYASITFPQTLTFPAGSIDNQCLTITITDDTEAELPDTLALSLENALGGLTAELGAQAKHVLIITDNDIICPAAGDIIVTEVMQNPSAVSDANGEWFEIHNTTGADIDLFGMLFKDDQTASEMILIDESLIISADGYLVFAVDGDTAINGGVRADFAYRDDPLFTLSNSTDGIVFTCLGTGIDTVIWDNGATFPDPNGKSMSLKKDFMNATANDLGVNWEEATIAYGDGDKGTPGCANDAACCYLVVEDAVTSCDAATYDVDTYTATVNFTDGGGSVYDITSTVGTVGGDDPSTTSSGTISITGINEGTDATVTISNAATGGTCNFIIEVTSPTCFTLICADAGSVIITEIMQDPSAVGDDLGEWFEVYNTTASDINLQGWNVIDDDKSLEDEGFTIENSLVIAAGSYLVFANNGDAASNGGLPTPDYIFTTDFLLGNNSDGMKLECSSTIIDQVIWDGGTNFPDPTGASMALHPNHYSAIDNDDGANWNIATTAYGDGDFGTPGVVNETVSVNLNKMNNFIIYPNPTNDGRFTIRFSAEAKGSRSIMIFDMLGKRVFDKTDLNKDELISTDLDTGIYILKVTENNKSGMLRLVVE